MLTDKDLLEPYVWKRTHTVLRRVQEGNLLILSDYSNIFIFNTLMAIKNDAEQNITRTPRENNKHEYQYKSNINRLIGEIKEQMPALLNNDKEEVQKIVDHIMEIGTKGLIYTKSNPPTNQKRNKKKYYHKKCKSNIKEAF